MFGLGTTELVILAVVLLLLFGNRLPGVMRSLGQGVVEFKKGVSGIQDEIHQGGPKKAAEQSEQEEAAQKNDEAEHGPSDSAPR